jgi:probable HAF family extracellular repeat protein
VAEVVPLTLIVDEVKTLPGLGDRSAALAVNRHGLISGYSGEWDSPSAVLWEGGGIFSLKKPDLAEPAAAEGVNSRREAVGWVGYSTGADRRASYWNQDGQKTLGPTNLRTWAYDIDDSGRIVGVEEGEDLIKRAIQWADANTTRTFLGGPPETWSEAFATNNRGQVVGWAETEASPYPVGVLWEDGERHVLPAAAAAFSWKAEDINELGQIVGQLDAGTPERQATLWLEGASAEPVLLSESLSVAQGINNLGQVVGWVETGGNRRAVLWMDGLTYPLATPFGQAAEAFSINDDGVVVGLEGAGTTRRALRWQVPIRASIAVEPGSGAVRLNGGGKVTVAVYGSPWFNVAHIDVGSLTLGDESGSDTPALRNRNGRVDFKFTDTDRDGHLDLLVSFDRRQLVANGDLEAGTERLFLLGRRTDGRPLRGVGAVTVTP